MNFSVRFIVAVFIAILCGNLTSAQLAVFNRPAEKPAPRSDRNSQMAHEQLLEKAKRGGIDVYFLGDSISRRWGATDYHLRVMSCVPNLPQADAFRPPIPIPPGQPRDVLRVAAGTWRRGRTRKTDYRRRSARAISSLKSHQSSSTFPAQLCKSLIIGGAGEGNRTLVTPILRPIQHHSVCNCFLIR
jgi:hypothetical protein